MCHKNLQPILSHCGDQLPFQKGNLKLSHTKSGLWIIQKIKGAWLKGERGAEIIIGGGLLTLYILNSLPTSFMAISITFCNLFMSAIDTVSFKLTLST